MVEEPGLPELPGTWLPPGLEFPGTELPEFELPGPAEPPPGEEAPGALPEPEVLLFAR